jgi:hypothetical protein
MQSEQTFEGWVVRLRPRGVGRWVDAAFLAVWLLFWTAGGVVAWWILLAGAWALLTGRPPGGEGEVPALPGALIGGAFLSVWLLFWTVGEWVVGRELLRCVAGEDRLLARPDGLRVWRRAGPFRVERFFTRDELRRVYALRGGGRLMAATARATHELSDLLRPEEAPRLIADLERELQLDRASAAREPVLAEGWTEVPLPEGGIALVRDPARRRVQARVAGAAAALALSVAGSLVGLAERDGSGWVLPTLAGGVGLLAGWGTLLLAWGRTEWRVERGRVVEQRRWRGRATERFVGTRLVLERSRDSDGDDRFTLVLADDAGGPAAGVARAQRRHRREIAGALHDETVPRQLGEWLAAKSGLRLTEWNTAGGTPVADVAQLRAALARTGRLGQWLARQWGESRAAPRSRPGARPGG